MHMFANGLMAYLWEADARLRSDPADARAWALIELVKSSYFFIRNLHGEAAVALGNFGEICMTADMLRLAVKLTELGAGDFNEDIERWTRNQIAESQIRGAITIEAHPGDPLRDMVGQKVVGLFFEDATHPLAIPDLPNDQGSLTLQLVACGLGNVIHGIHDVWQHIVELRSNVARVNLLMNRATWYLDVKSEVPYRGAVHIVTAADLGPIDTVEIRIPDGTNPATVQVTADGAAVTWGWTANYVHVPNVKPSTTYSLVFPLPFQQLTFRQVRNQAQNWAESSYSPDPGTGQDYGFHEYAPENTYLGTLRGNTLVNTSHWPSFGIWLYRGVDLDRDYLASLGAADTPSAAPSHAVSRFRLRPSPFK